MPIDIVQLRAAKGGDPERFREFQRRRFKSESIIDEVIQLDDNWRQARFQFEQLRSRQNQLQKQVAQLKKQNPEDESAAPLIEEIKELDT